MRALDAGRAVAVSGKFGCGRTTLLRHTATACGDRFHFSFVDFSGPPRVTWETLAATSKQDSPAGRRRRRIGYRTVRARALQRVPDDRRQVVVLDNVERVTPARLDVVKRLKLTDRFRIVAILEGHLPEHERQHLLRWLTPVDLVRLGPLSQSQVRRLVAEAARDLGLRWGDDKIAAVATGTGGHPLSLRQALERAAREGKA